eukprot:774827-Pleurochrysis_carterae.AAC.1
MATRQKQAAGREACGAILGRSTTRTWAGVCHKRLADAVTLRGDALVAPVRCFRVGCEHEPAISSGCCVAWEGGGRRNAGSGCGVRSLASSSELSLSIKLKLP